MQVEQLEGPAAHIDGGDFFWAEPPKPKVCCWPAFTDCYLDDIWVCGSQHLQPSSVCAQASIIVPFTTFSLHIQEDPKVTKKKRRAWRRKRGLKGSEGTEPEALPLAVIDKSNKVIAAAALNTQARGPAAMMRPVDCCVTACSVQQT